MDGDTTQSSSDQADTTDPAVLAAINGGPSTGAGSLFPVQNAAGDFVADPSNIVGATSSLFASVPWYVWAALAGVVVLRVAR
jgi:hypothetical protein